MQGVTSTPPSDDLPRAGAGEAPISWRAVPGRLTPYVIITLIANTLIAALLTAAMPPPPDVPQPHDHFLSNLVYSHFIGLSILLLIVVPRLTFWPSDKLVPWQAALHLAAATVVGFVGGSYAASFLLGAPPLIRAREPGDNALLVAALLTVMASVGCTTFFWLRERVSTLRLEASGERARAETERARAEAASRQATEAQLNLIRTQLEPHMLFNTLANLRSLMTVDPPRAQLMMDRLISFLRATLAASRHDETTLRAEFDLLHDYLELIAIRMGPRLTFSLDLPAHLASIPVLPLLLQPLVENAVRHGIEPAIDGGRIDVRATFDAGRLKLVVEDTGVGAPSAACGIPAQPEAAGHGGGFGLSQIRERLWTAHGTAASLAIESPPTPAGRPSMKGAAVKEPSMQEPSMKKASVKEACTEVASMERRDRTGTRVTIILPAPVAARP